MPTELELCVALACPLWTSGAGTFRLDVGVAGDEALVRPPGAAREVPVAGRPEALDVEQGRSARSHADRVVWRLLAWTSAFTGQRHSRLTMHRLAVLVRSESGLMVPE